MKKTISILTLLLTLTIGLYEANSQNTTKKAHEKSTNAYVTPTEDFSVSNLKKGYSLSKANELHKAWNLQKFLDITEAGAYSYLNLSEFMPHAVIRRDGPVKELERALNPAIGQIALDNASTGKISLESMITADKSPVQGLLVVHKGKIIYEKYPGMRKTDNHVWMSNAKIIAGLLVAQFEEEGLLNVQHAVSGYVPETKGTAWENIKIIDIMNMQSGLDLEENPVSRKGGTPYSVFVAAEVGNPSPSGKVLTHNEALLQIPKRHKPAMAFEYSSANTQMLCLLIEAVGKKRISELITERIWMHAGMAGDATLALTPQGNGIIHGLISSRLEDMAKVGMLYTPAWKVVASKKVVSEGILKKIQTSGKKDNYMKGSLGPRMAAEFREQPVFNAYQWDAVFADGDIYKSGMNGQGIYVSPEKDAVIVWFATGFTEIPMEAFSRKIAKSLQ